MLRYVVICIIMTSVFFISSCSKPTDPDDAIQVYEIKKSAKAGKVWELKYTLPTQIPWKSGHKSVRQTGLSADDEGILYVSTTGNGLYKINTMTSEIKEANYGIVKIVEFGGELLNVWSILAYDNKVFAGSGGTISNSRIFISDNNAESFTKVVSFDSLGIFNTLSRSPKGFIFAGGKGLFYYSADNGANWTPLMNKIEPNIYGYIWQFTFDTNSNVYAATDKGVFYSDIRNLNFKRVGLLTEPIYGMDINSEGWIYAASNKAKIYVSKDKGSTWDALPASPSKICYCLYINSQGDIMAGAEGGIYVSSDKGVTWTFIDVDNQFISRIINDKDGNLWAGSYMNRVYKCVN